MSIYISDNKLIKSFLSKIRDKKSNSVVFGKNLKKVTEALVLEASKEFSLVDYKIETPIKECVAKKLSDSIVIVPVLRAGLIMSEALSSFFEDCAVIHLGIYRNEDLNAVKYYEKIPPHIDRKNSKVILCDPLIATGVTLAKALEILESNGFENIMVLSIIMSEIAQKLITEKYPNLNVYVAEIDKELNDHGYIIPGVGDAGDRLFGTK
ncbi:uracil phosphoribosyltransferase [Mycoplasma parvum]|uniref:Phosphoribosyltransferase domain-containing protein n=1 Tax=Mycoplasma parvum str. Indiana TaxID=1403316 RepID=U5NCT3_9MOLU|nr:uracil phosphoribosyltransferase [Mycoplasma parvum]AGX89336.1 hypothetical protein PRV_03055 [Mycoplasma parvum str. Indiana]